VVYQPHHSVKNGGLPATLLLNHQPTPHLACYLASQRMLMPTVNPALHLLNRMRHKVPCRSSRAWQHPVMQPSLVQAGQRCCSSPILTDANSCEPSLTFAEEKDGVMLLLHLHQLCRQPSFCGPTFAYATVSPALHSRKRTRPDTSTTPSADIPL